MGLRSMSFRERFMLNFLTSCSSWLAAPPCADSVWCNSNLFDCWPHPPRVPPPRDRPLPIVGRNPATDKEVGGASRSFTVCVRFVESSTMSSCTPWTMNCSIDMYPNFSGMRL